jgi:hypothetical protein
VRHWAGLLAERQVRLLHQGSGLLVVPLGVQQQEQRLVDRLEQPQAQRRVMLLARQHAQIVRRKIAMKSGERLAKNALNNFVLAILSVG